MPYTGSQHIDGCASGAAKEAAITGITAVMQNYLAMAATEAGLTEEQRAQYEHLRMVSLTRACSCQNACKTGLQTLLL